MIPKATLRIAALVLGCGGCVGSAAAALQVDPAAPPERLIDLSALPRRSPLAGLAALELRSRITFAEATSAPHRLELSCAFPARVRWYFGLESGPAGSRWITYRVGERTLVVPEGSDEWIELEAEERATCLRRMESRLALFLWPDYGNWSPAAPPAPRTWALADPRTGAPLGHVSAEIDAAGFPAALCVRDEHGREQERLLVRARTPRHGRSWPTTLEMWSEGELVWHEQVELIATEVSLPDEFFVPPSARPRRPNVPANVATRDVRLPSSAVRRLPLGRVSGRDELLQLAWTHWSAAERELAALGLALDPGIAIELSPQGEAQALLLLLSRSAGSERPGWTAVAPRPALSRMHGEWPASIALELELLGAAVPRGARPETAYLRLFDLRSAATGARSAQRVQLVQPYEPPG